MTAPLVEVKDLKVAFPGADSAVEAISGVSIGLQPGETLGIVGESGCGKSVTMLALMGLLPKGVATSGSILLDGREILGLPDPELAKLRGKRIAMIFQDPLTALNPVLTIGDQLFEAIRLHNRDLSPDQVKARAIELLNTVAIPESERRLRQYPHQFSGGMRQRVMIAMAVANDPDVLIADEPTTALDVTVQAQILDVLKAMRDRLGLALVIITHDLGVVAGIADRIAVMYAGRIVEEGLVDDVFTSPAHPYTRGLLAAVPRTDAYADRLTPIEGNPPSLTARPSGCPFHPRCPIAADVCARVRPDLRPAKASRAACHFAEERREAAE
ncbi:MAG: ABC transporter ATP-binding protein [Hyphomicrobiales bacterium]